MIFSFEKLLICFGLVICHYSCDCKVDQNVFIDRIGEAPKEGGYQDEKFWIWGSSVIRGEDNKYHMFASRWPRELNFGNWVTNSEIVHAVSDSAVGPYSTVGVVLPARGKEYWDGMCTHNPRIVKYGNKFLLYYFGTSYDFERPSPAKAKVSAENWQNAWNNKRIGVAISESVYGPWKRLDHPIIEPRQSHWDATITSNPSPVVNEKTGEILLMYKSSLKEAGAPLMLGMAKATNPEGPYTRLSEDPILQFTTDENERIDLEDPFVWWNGEHYEAIIKDRSGVLCGEEGGGVHAWSLDAVDWHLYENPRAYSRYIRWDDGTRSYQNHFERPFLLIEDGKPTYFFAATGNGDKAWSFDKTWNMVIPLR